MTTKTQAVPRSGPPRRLPILLACALAALLGAGCNPDIPQDGIPAFVELEFDPSSSPPKSYEPTLLVTNAETGLLDFSAAGMNIPVDPLECGTQTELPVATCEFYWYLQQLDGFPTLTPARTPVSAAIDLASVTLPGNLYIREFLRGQAPVTDGTTSYEDGYLKFDPAAGWDINGLYLVAVRGYAGGVTDTDGNEAVKSIIYVLLQQDNPLTCGITDATDPALLDCGFYSLFSNDARFKDLPAGTKEATILATLAQLEQLRTLYKGESALPIDVWTQMADPDWADMPPEQVGILWAFRTHSASVIELNPNKGIAPVATSSTEITLPVKGPIVESTLSPFSLGTPAGTVFLLNVTKLLVNPFDPDALPAFTPTFADGQLTLTLTAGNLVVGDMYALLVTNEVQGKTDKPIVPSPVTVFLRSRGALVDNYDLCASDPPTAAPLVPGLSGAEACQLEAGRQQFMALLDDELIIGATTVPGFRDNGLTREIVAYLYGFAYTAQ